MIASHGDFDVCPVDGQEDFSNLLRYSTQLKIDQHRSWFRGEK